MYTPTLVLVFLLSLLAPSFAMANVELLPRQGGGPGATAQLSLLSTLSQSSLMSSSMPSSSMTSTGSMTTTLPASVSASVSASMASVSASVSLATNAVTGGGSGSGDTGGVGGAGISDAEARASVSGVWVGLLAGMVGLMGMS